MKNNGISCESNEINAVFGVDKNCRNEEFPEMVENFVDYVGEEGQDFLG